VGESSEEYLWVQAYQPPEKGMPQPVLISNADNVLFANEIHALIAPLVGKESALRENNQARPSAAVVQWAAKNKEQALKLVAEAKAKAEAEQKERERMAAEAKAKMQAELRELSGKLETGAAGSSLSLPLSTEVNQAFCFVPSGSFMMGNPDPDPAFSGSVGNQVEVKLTRHFWLAKTEVTQAQWEAVMGGNPSNHKGTNLPVENVSWEDAQAFIAKLNQKKILPQGWKFALPTEAQWEYASRAGEDGPESGGSLDDVGWHGQYVGTHEVAKKKANAWGLCDMHGNVWEWCSNWAGDRLKSGGIDLTGPSSGSMRVERGGGVGRTKFSIGENWATSVPTPSFYCYCSNPPEFRDMNLGFRPALVPSR
jgi:formylglycine-generating enzyme required for sulfatase activity